jgi:hypothetical protein
MDENGRDLTAKQKRAIPHLSAAPSREEGCRRAAIGRSTLTRWLSEPSFRRALAEAQDETYQEALRDVQRAVGEAVEVLRGLLKVDTEGVRLRAAGEILAFGLRARDALVIEERLQALEERVMEIKPTVSRVEV